MISKTFKNLITNFKILTQKFKNCKILIKKFKILINTNVTTIDNNQWEH